jgi:hypothetical protein
MEDDLDKLIDGALAGYSNVEPLAGLEGRVLGKVRVVEAARKRRRLWALAIPALAALVLIAFFVRKPQQPVPVAKVMAPPAPVVLAPPAPPVVVAQTPRQVVKVRKPAPSPELPKRPMFPTPSALTQDERLLLSLAESHPEALPGPLPADIDIKPIQIAPLDIQGDQ